MTTTIEPVDSSGDEIGILRTRIDALDEGIIALVRERQQLSERVQAHRLAAGGVRLALSRERAIIDTYRAELGTGGPALADAVLRACRGTL